MKVPFQGKNEQPNQPVNPENVDWQKETDVMMTWSIHKVYGWAKAINPNYIESMKQNERARAQEEATSSMDTNKLVLYMIMFMIGASLAYIMVQKGVPQDVASAAGGAGGGTSISLAAMIGRQTLQQLRRKMV